MERHYFVRDRRVEVEEIDGVNALRIARDSEGQPLATIASFGAPGADQILRAARDMSPDVLQTFQHAGWEFVTPSAETQAHVSRSQFPEHVEAVGTIVVHSGETIGILTRLLNVQLDARLSETDAEAILAARNIQIVRRINFAPNLYETLAIGWDDAIAASVDLHTDNNFVFAEPSFVQHIPARATPTDPEFGKQWQWSNDGSNSGTSGADVHARDAWDYTFGSDVSVAVIDNGFDAAHEDISAAVSSNSGYFQSTGDFKQGKSGIPVSNHGTFCAGMVGARRDNGKGGVGAAPDCTLMLIACLGDQIGTQTTLARSVAYAIDPNNEVQGAAAGSCADILVCSLGPNGANWQMTATLELALDQTPSGRQGKGLAVFWAASNGRNVDVSLDKVVSHRNVIAVVRSNRNDLEDNTARGTEVELIAPGVDVFSTRSGNRYGISTGTSYAAPCAAGCAALALSMNRSLTAGQLRTIMRDSADKIGGVQYDANGHNPDYGFGRVNALQAVLVASGP